MFTIIAANARRQRECPIAVSQQQQIQKPPQPTKRARTISQTKTTKSTYIPLQPPKDLHLIEELVVVMPSTVSVDTSLILPDFTGDLAQHVTHIRIYQRSTDGNYY